VERPENSAYELWPILTEKEPDFNKIVSLILSSHSREVSKKYCYFSTHTDKNSVFLKSKVRQKGKITGGVANYCKELETLSHLGILCQSSDDSLNYNDRGDNYANSQQHNFADLHCFCV
jgi:hypothetical protein